jgi:hypothetical protein
MGLFVVCPDAASASRGYETGTFSDARALAGACDLFQGVVEAGDRRTEVRNACKWRVDIGSAGAVLSTSFGREGLATAFTTQLDRYRLEPDPPVAVGEASSLRGCPQVGEHGEHAAV